MTIHGQSSEYLLKPKADLEEKSETFKARVGSAGGAARHAFTTDSSQWFSPAAVKTHLGTTGSFSTSSFILISPSPIVFKSCPLITLQLKAIKEFSEQHRFQQRL